MKTNHKHFLAAALWLAVMLALVSPAPVDAAPPMFVPFQGQLTDSQGQPITGSVSVVFKLYSAASGGSLLWTESQSPVADSGIINVVLGTSTVLDLAFDTTYYLDITVGADAAMTPRVQLIPTPYALTARNVSDSSVGFGRMNVLGPVLLGDKTTTPADTLHVLGTMRVITPNAAGTFVVNSAGRVGIGTTSPGAALDVVGAAKFSDSLIVSDTLLFVNKQTGRIGVGTTSPVTEFTVDGAIYMRQSNAATLSIFNTSTTAGITGRAAISLVPQNGASQQDIYGSDSALSLRTGGYPGSVATMERMRITAAGNIGIGTANPTDSLVVVGPTRVSSSSGAVALYVNSAGNVGVGTVSPADSLHVAGRIMMDTEGSAGAAQDGTIRWSGSDFEGRKAGAWSSLTGVGAGGDITGVTAGSGLSGGGASGAVTVQVDTAYAHTWTARQTFTAGSSFSDSLIVSDTVLVVNKQSGNVGIGTAGPIRQLSITGGGASTVSGIGITNNEDAVTEFGLFAVGSSHSTLGGGTAGDVNFVLGKSGLSTLVIKENGNVGIGDTSPGARLDVAGDVNVSDSLVVGDTRLVVLKSGYVGIGTTAPSGNLTIHGGATNAILQMQNTSTGGAVTDGFELSYGTDAYVWNHEATALLLATSGAERMRITSAGNVGIGTTSPGDSLHVKGTFRVISNSASGTVVIDNSGRMGIGTTNPAQTLDVAGTTVISGNARIGISGSPRSALDVWGQLGEDPTITLERNSTLISAGDTLGGIDFYSNDGSANNSGVVGKIAMVAGSGWAVGNDANADMVFHSNFGAAPSAEAMRITGGGHVGINTVNPSDSLHVNGSAKIEDTLVVTAPFHVRLDNQAGTFVINSNGWVGIDTTLTPYPINVGNGAYLTAGGMWTNASSRNLKQDIEPVSANDAVNAVMAMEPVTYRYTREPGETYVGFIAEDVPELVATSGRVGMNPMDVVAVLTKVVQEQQKQIDQLRGEITAMKGTAR